MSNLRQKLNALQAERVPPGWLTKEEVSLKENAAHGSGGVAILIRDAIGAGLLEQRYFRVLWGSGLRRRPHYRYTRKAR